jgi:tetratricopeptide (TPR) repeat protein
MAKQRVASASKTAARSRTSTKAATKKATKPAGRSGAARKTAKNAKKAVKTKTARTKTMTGSKTTARRPPPAKGRKAPAPVVNIRQAYAKAVALYEKGVKAMQRKNYDTAATTLRRLLDEYPEERELHERAKLYLNVCERHEAPKDKAPRGADARVLAATVALNRRELDEALSLLRGAMASHAGDDHVQYMLAMTHALLGDPAASAIHLEKAIALNPDNRLQARQEPDFDLVRESAPLLALLSGE